MPSLRALSAGTVQVGVTGGMMVGEASESAPLGGLPPARRVLLGHAKIELAAVELRYAGDKQVLGTDDGFSLQSWLETPLRLTRLQRAEEQQLEMTVGPAGAAPTSIETKARGWQFLTTDGRLTVTVLPDKVRIQTRNYERWRDSLLEPLLAVLSSIEDVVKPALVQRVGLRYINRLTDAHADNVHSWDGRIAATILGPLSHEVLGGAVTAAQQQFELSLGEGQGSTIRHGVFRDAIMRNAYSYLIDIDVFDQATARFDRNAIAGHATQLNRTALAIFQQMITPDYLESLDPVAIDDDETEGD